MDRLDLSSLRSFWPHLLLAVTFGAAGYVALHAHEARKAQLATVHEALQDYGSFASWSYEQHAREALEAAFWQFLTPVNHGDALHVSPRIPRAADLVHYLPWDSAGCYCHRPDYVPDRVFSLRIGSDSLDVAVNLHEGPIRGIRVSGPPEAHPGTDAASDEHPAAAGAGERGPLIERLTTHARERYRLSWRLAVLPGSAGEGASLLGYTLMPTVRGDTILYGLEFPPREVELLFGRVLDDRELLPETFVRDRPNRELLRASVRTGDGRPLFSSGPPGEAELVGTATFPPRLGGLAVRTAIGPEVAGDLLIGGLPESRLPLMLGILAVAAALAVVSVGQVRKESRLARERTDFVSAVSHELRTPLAQIRLYLETLRMGRFRTEAQREDALDRVDRETGRLSHLVENVLRFARSERSASSPDASLLALGPEVRDAVETFAPLADARDVTIEVDVDEEVAVRADRSAIRQVLINLLDNAVKYGPAGQTVTVRGRHDAGRAVLAVEDRGPGVRRSERERIWEAFRRGRGPDQRAVGGSGIGLSVVREIARGLGGEARVEDARGGGAHFVVEVPGERVAGAGRPAAPAARGA